MTLLGRLLTNRRAGDTHTAWKMPNLQGPELLTLTSRQFSDGGSMPLDNCAKHVGGADLSPIWLGARSRPAPHSSSWSSRTSISPSGSPPYTASP